MKNLVEWPSILHAPPDILRRLRDIRPNAELLYIGEGRWMLGEVRWNWERYRRAVQIIAQWWENRKVEGAGIHLLPQQQAFLRDGILMLQGFVWIRDYHGDPDGRIVNDYSRMCWKEDHGLLDDDFRQMAKESDGQTGLLQRIKMMSDRIRAEGRSDHRILMKKRRSVNLYVPPSGALFVPPKAQQRIVTV